MSVPTSRLEAFSDGVIAIIITVMVFDLKLHEIPTEKNVWHELFLLMPKFAAYLFSFLMLGIMWVNHHQLFHQIKHTDRKLLWYNMHLLFWMSLVPFAANFIGANYLLPVAAFFYGIIFLMIAVAFTLMRSYVIGNRLLHETISKAAQHRIIIKNRIAMGIYISAIAMSWVSVFISFVLFFAVPVMYFIPENITHENQQ